VIVVIFGIHCSCELCYCSVTVHFKFADGSKKTAKAKVGENLLDAVLSNNLDIDGYGTDIIIMFVQRDRIIS